MASQRRDWDLSSLPGMAVVDESDALKGFVIYSTDSLNVQILVLEVWSCRKLVGSMLLRAVADEARKAGYVNIRLCVGEEGMTCPMRYYQSYGFSLKALHIDSAGSTSESPHRFEFEMLLKTEQ